MTDQAYRTTARTLLDVAADPELELSAIISAHLGLIAERTAARKAKKSSQQRAWENSLPVLAQDLVEAGLPEVDMLIEYPMPVSGGRKADVVLAGAHPETGADNYVVVELKQWSEAVLEFNSDQIVWLESMAGTHLHPIDQVRGYCQYLSQYLQVLHNRPEALHGVAYLHNADRTSVTQLLRRPGNDQGRLFTGDRRNDFRQYLRRQFAPVSHPEAADRLLSSDLRPRMSFLDFATQELRTPTGTTLLDNQALAYETVMQAVRESRQGNNKSVVIVTGGPGSGKSMIALKLLAALAREPNQRVLHATGSSAITETMRKVPGKGSLKRRKLFSYYRNLAKAEQNSLDVLICDEAHRIRKTSEHRFTPKEVRASKRPQIDELMAAARVPVFLLDAHQVVRPEEVGTFELINEHARRSGFPVHRIELDGQFRCGGSAVYEEWVLNLLHLRPLGPTKWNGDENFEVRVAESPQAMEDFLRAEIDAGHTARIAAGYCWPWTKKPNPDGTLVHDVVIGDWTKPWNMHGRNESEDIPKSDYWATAPGGFEQVGCIYTAQGFEYDWAGVILGPDIVVDNQRLVVCRAANKDDKVQGPKRSPVPDEDFEKLVRNTYKVLLTRGMRGVVIYAVDPAKQQFLAELIDERAMAG
ncbi:DUF2075 domain-containing protein [Nocardia sp. XZ_19_385]|uniref:DUF2075 domain-containing protein n=1 Tax=Nocardia sp. XZ_19_385 TaxID=2769488 RepID=UPI00188E70C7|nr:DUF2075 domain-containing protein [Nocardia sp. XZ_19_385]